VAYETKAIFAAVGQIMKMANGDMEKAYNAVAKMANAEGIVLEPYNDNEEPSKAAD
jgi:hypothetical protein